MLSLRKLVAIGTLSILTAFSVSPAHATTVVLDFQSPVVAPLSLDADSPGIVNGNCNVKPCLGVNSESPAVLTIASPLTFSISSFWFQLLGKGDNLIVTTSKGVLTLLESVYPHNNGGQVIDLSSNPDFKDITSLSFLMSSKGNARVDDITVTYDSPAPVPLPAAGILLAGALGMIAAVRGRRQAA